MNWVSAANLLSEDFDKAMFMSAIHTFSSRQFSEDTDIGTLLDMMLMGAEICR